MAAEPERKRLTDGGDAPRPRAGGLASFIGVNLVTPRGVVAHQDTDAITAPGELGEFEMLPGHVPALSALRPGVLTIGGKTRVKYAVSAGYLRIDGASDVEILVEAAELGSEVDVEAARADLRTAEADLATWGADKPADGDYINLVQRVQWAKARLDAAGAPAATH